MPADAKLVRDLFLAAAEMPAADRESYLADHCGDDAELRAAVERLLAAHEHPATVLDRPAPGIPTADYPSINERPGMMVGPYKLMEQIGEGGFGLVFVAEQTQPLKRKVALKVIKPGMDSKQVIARFEAERQALAMMDHPNIARVLDAGTTASGLPYFVMELVRGIPITDYCDKNHLTPNERLELFISVCHAIQHAHQKGIIHRDIKPSNVLVGAHDSKPMAKVIDFGVAKAISHDLTQRTIYTNFLQMIGTPLYMSPEQAEMSVLDIDTRSDIYSLGVLLYELLTGSTPLDKKRFAKAAYDEVRRMIREDEPPKPSHRLSTCDTRASVAASRKTEPAKLSRMLRGELDWVVMKALEKDRTRRYETANGLARDLQRYLSDEVVEARPPSAGYRMSKFVRRHKGQVIAASLLLLTLLTGIAGTTWGLIAARQQEQVARRQEMIARQEAAEKEKARLAEAERVKERDAALHQEAERVQERDAALDDANHRLDNGSFLLAVTDYDRRDIDLARLRLDSIAVKHRGWEWHYLRRLVRGGIFTMYEHTSPVTSVAFSPDGTRIVAGSGDNTAKVRNARTGLPLLELKGHTHSVSSVAFSPDGMRIATGSKDGTARVWDAQTGATLKELTGHSGEVRSLAFSPDGTRIVSGRSQNGKPGEVKVWDAQTGTSLVELKGHRLGVTSVAFSPDGTRIATGSYDLTAKVWDAQTGKPLLELKGHKFGVTSVAFSPDGTRIVSGGSQNRSQYSTQYNKPGEANVWDAQTGTRLLELKGHTDGVTSVAFRPDGMRIATASLDRITMLWDSRTGTPLLELKGHANSVSSVAFSPDGMRIVTGSLDKTAKMWDSWTGVPQLELNERKVGGVTPVAFSPDGRRVVTGRNPAKLWDARTGAQLLELKGTKSVESVAFSPDGTRVVTAGGGDTAKVWDAQTGTRLLELKGHTQLLTSVAFSPDAARIATASMDSTAKVWDARNGTPLLELKGHRTGIRCVAFSPDGTRIATAGNDATAKVWDARTGTTLLDLKGHAVWVLTVAFSPDGARIVTGSHDTTAKVWDARTGTPLLELIGHTSGVLDAAFSPDGTRIVTASWDQTARVWDAQTGTPLLELKGHMDKLSSVAFSPDGTRIATGCFDHTVKVWDAPTGRPPLELKGHTKRVSCLAFSPDGTRIVTGGNDHTAKVWDARTATLLLELMGHTGAVFGVGFSPDGTRIVTGSYDQTAKVWDAQSGTLQLELKSKVGAVRTVAFSLDGARIVTESAPNLQLRGKDVTEVWDARTGQEFKGDPKPPTLPPDQNGQDSRVFVRQDGNSVEFIPVQPDAEELSYRRLHTEPNFQRYRAAYDAARAAKDDFATRFYLKLLPKGTVQDAKTGSEAKTAAERATAVGRTENELVQLVPLLTANPKDTYLLQKVAALQAWFGRDKELADTCQKGLELAKNTAVPETAERVAKACCVLPSTEKTQVEAALALARQAVNIGGKNPNRLWFHLALGMSEYRSGHFAEADAELTAVASGAQNNRYLAGTAAFYRAMSLFQQGKQDEAGKLAAEAAANMKPLPKDEKKPLAANANHDDLILWLAYKEAKDMIQFDATAAPGGK